MSMTAHLLAAVLVGPAPVQFEVKLSKQAIKPGESIRAELVAKNTSRQPVVVAKAICGRQGDLGRCPCRLRQREPLPRCR